MRYVAAAFTALTLISACNSKTDHASSKQLNIPSDEKLLTLHVETETQPLQTLINELVPRARAEQASGGLALPVSLSYAACGATSTIPGTHLCVYNSQLAMNATLSRISAWVERKILLNHSDLLWDKGTLNVQGHNLAGEDIRRFEKFFLEIDPVSKRSRRDDFDAILNASGFLSMDIRDFLNVEKSFWEMYLEPKIKSESKFYLITAYIGSGFGPLHHEIMHALFASNAVVQEIVRDFWKNSISDEDKQNIIEELSRFYGVESDDPKEPSFLLLTEFQAYLLQQREGNGHPLKEMAETYGPQLKSKLSEKGIELPTVNQPK